MMARQLPCDYVSAIETAVFEAWVEKGEPLTVKEIAELVDFSESTVRKHANDCMRLNWTHKDIPVAWSSPRRCDALEPSRYALRREIGNLREELNAADTQAHLRGVTNDKLREDVVKLQDQVDRVTQRGSEFRTMLKAVLKWLKVNNDIGRLPPDGTGKGVIDSIEKTVAPKEKN